MPVLNSLWGIKNSQKISTSYGFVQRCITLVATQFHLFVAGQVAGFSQFKG